MARRFLWLLTLAVALPLAAQAPVALTIGQRDSLTSWVLNEERKLEVYLPEGYERGDQRYPVIYLLDGDGHFHHTTGIVSFLTQQGRMPPVILVGIPNTDRTRDLTPVTHTDSAGEFPTAGGSQAFLQFFREELFPYIESRYRTLPFRVLIGHSFGGLLAIETLETHPEMFRGYIAISPSLWWDGMAYARRAAEDLRRQPGLRAWVYMTTGNEGGNMLAGAQQVADAFQTAGLPGLRWKFLHMPAESHGSIPHRSTYDGLEFIFADMTLTEEEGVALVAAGLPGLDRRYRMVSEAYGYPIATPEALINQLGYIQLRGGKPEQAIVTFRENIRRFPGSANTYDSLGDAYRATNKLPQAVEAYRRAVEIGVPVGDPVVPFSSQKMREVEQQMATGGPG